MPTNYRRQDFQILRFFIQAMDFGRVLRWRDEGQKPFTSAEAVILMNEDNLQHCAGMAIMANLCIMKAKKEGDAKTSDLDLSVVVTMIFTHDADEYLTADSQNKCMSYREKELRARTVIFTQWKQFDIGSTLVALTKEYHEKKSDAARFVKALDELQAWIYLIQTRGFAASNRNFQNPDEIQGYTLALEFPTLARLAKILLRIIAN